MAVIFVGLVLLTIGTWVYLVPGSSGCSSAGPGPCSPPPTPPVIYEMSYALIGTGVLATVLGLLVLVRSRRKGLTV